MRPLSNNPFEIDMDNLEMPFAASQGGEAWNYPIYPSRRRRDWRKIIFIALLAVLALGYIGSSLLTVTKINLYGLTHVERSKVQDSLGFSKGDSIFAFSLTDVKNRVEEIHLVAEAHVLRDWSGKITITITERVPAIIKMEEDAFAIMDEEGVVLERTKDISSYGLPVFRGEFVAAEAMALWNVVLKYPLVGHQLTLFHYVSEGRWDVYLDDEIQLMLAEQDVEASWRAFLLTPSLERQLQKKPHLIDARQSSDIVFDMIVSFYRGSNYEN